MRGRDLKREQLIAEEENELESLVASKRKSFVIEEGAEGAEPADEDSSDSGSDAPAESSYTKLVTMLKAGVKRKRGRKDYHDDVEKDESLSDKDEISQGEADLASVASGDEEVDEEEVEDATDAFNAHLESATVETIQRADDKSKLFKELQESMHDKAYKWGIVASRPSSERPKGSLKMRLQTQWDAYLEKHQAARESPLKNELLGSFLSYLDLYYSFAEVSDRRIIDAVCACHLLNHIFKTRDLVLRNNEKLKASEDLELRDQGFTRPKVLVLVPFRTTAYRIVNPRYAPSR